MRFLSCGGELNHHGKPVCDCLYNILGNNFIRITTKKISNERINLGYTEKEDIPYNSVIENCSQEEIRDIVSWADVVDFGSAPEEYLHEAVSQGKIVFIRLERLFKEGYLKILHPKIFLRYYRRYFRYRKNKNVYFLCTSAYAASDLAKIGIRSERVLTWAYCPEFKELESDAFERKCDKLNLLWCGRLISWKHPEIAVKIAHELKKLNCNFELKIIGDGPLKEKLAAMIKNFNLSSEVNLCGAVEASLVRQHMQNADVFLTTSDHNEGWGVVVNEAMSSGCAVFAAKEMGAVPTLIKDGENGFHITAGKEEEVARKITELFNSPEKLKNFKTAAYETIKTGFTPEIYAKVFIEMADEALNGEVSDRNGLGNKEFK